MSVTLAGIYNVRDLGGHDAMNGSAVRTDVLVRASSLHRLVDESSWLNAGFRTTIDLRYQREISAFPLPEFVHDSLHAPMLPDNWRSNEEAKSMPAAEFLCEVFIDMIDLGGDSVKQVFERLADPEAYPVIFFCMAGKDRTGVLAATVLGILGVSDADIIEDFTLSGDEVVALVEDLRGREDYENHPMMSQPEELLRAPRAAMELFLIEVRNSYGGFAELVRGFGISEETIAAVRTNLLVTI